MKLSLLTGNYQVRTTGYRAMMRGRSDSACIPRGKTDALVDLDRDHAADASARWHWRLASDTRPVARSNHRRSAERRPTAALSMIRGVRR